MRYAELPVDYGFVVREAALKDRNVAFEKLLHVFEVDAPLDQIEGIITFGPHFGREPADQLFKELQQIGLVYVEDFFIFAPDAPEWCVFGVKSKAAILPFTKAG